jgi:hypothetical protein
MKGDISGGNIMCTPTPFDDYLFDLRGYLILENAIEPELLDELNAEFDQFPRDLPLGGWYKGAQRRDYNPSTGMELHHCLEIGGPFEKLIDHPSWLAYVQKYCGEQGSYVEGLFIDECLTSLRNSGGHITLHSGGYEGALRGKYLYDNGVFRCGQINILMALTDIGEGDGATIIVPGSHKSNLPLPDMQEYFYGGPKAGQQPPAAVQAHLKKGDVLLFVDGITHGGSARINSGERRVIIYRYGPSWGRTRFGYEYSEELLSRLTPRRRRILEPVPKCHPGADWVPVEAPIVARRAEEAGRKV